MFSFTPSRRRRSFSLRVFFFFFSSSSSLLFLSPSTTAEDEKSLGRAALDANDERCPFDKIYDRRSADGRFHQPSSPRARATETIPRAKSGVELVPGAGQQRDETAEPVRGCEEQRHTWYSGWSEVGPGSGCRA